MVTRWLVLSVCVLVVVAGCGGDSDDNGDSGTSDPTATAQDSGAPADTPSDASDEPEEESDTGSGSIEFTTVRGARPNSTADVVVVAEPRTECGITYTAPDGTVGEMRGLEPKTSSGNGRLTWSWKIDPDTPSGEGTVAVTCGDDTAVTAITIQ